MFLLKQIPSMQIIYTNDFRQKRGEGEDIKSLLSGLFFRMHYHGHI